MLGVKDKKEVMLNHLKGYQHKLIKTMLYMLLVASGYALAEEGRVFTPTDQAAASPMIDIDTSYTPEELSQDGPLTQEQIDAHHQRIHQQIVAYEKQQQAQRKQEQEQYQKDLVARLTQKSEAQKNQSQNFPITVTYAAHQNVQPIPSVENSTLHPYQANEAKSPWFILMVFAVLIGMVLWWWTSHRQQTQKSYARPRHQATYHQTAQQGWQSNISAGEHYSENHQQQTRGHQQHSQQQNSTFPPPAPISTSDRVKAYLDDFFSNQPQNAMSYRQELHALKLDFSEESLERLDHLLLSIKQQTKPDYAGYCEQYDHQQFVIFCGVYLATTIARVTHQSMKWFSLEEFNARFGGANGRGDIPQTLGTLLSCIFGNDCHHLPIEVICDGLFTASPVNTCTERLAFYQKNAQTLLLISPNSQHLDIEPLSASQEMWVKVMNMAGNLASYSLYMIEGGTTLTPTFIRWIEDKLCFVSLMDGDGDTGLNQLRLNPEQLPYQAFAHDIYANLPYGRMDAISLHIRSYGKYYAEWVITIPYRPAQHLEGFAFFTPILAFASTDKVLNPLLFKAFYQGIDSFKSPTNTWQRYFKHEPTFI